MKHSSRSGFATSKQTSSPSTSRPGFSPSYVGYGDSKKSETMELREALNKAINERNEDNKMATVKKIVACMTVGMDVSELFQSIIMVSNTSNLILKKMIYLYLGHYAKENEHMALLSVNSILKDTNDDSPMIRGMALRWLSSLSTPSLVEHMLEPVKRGLIDVSAYVRRNACLACAKIYHISPEHIKGPGFVNKLYELIRDKDPAVCVNSLRALGEILQDEGGVVINQKMVIHLLSQFGEFNNWGRCLILQLLRNYQPTSDEDLFGVMNVFDKYFSSSHSGIVLSVIHLFLTFSQTKSEIHEHVFLRLKNPLQTLLVGAGAEQCYVILSHILLVSKRVPTLFTGEYKQFFVKAKDPLYLRLLKVQILEILADESSSKEIMIEFSSYALDKKPEFSTESIRAIGRLAMRVPTASAVALEILIGFLELEQSQHVMSTTLVCLKDMLRRFPEQARDIIPRLAQSLDVVEDTDAKTAIVTMIGEYGEIIDDGPYIIEEVINNWEKQDSKVKTQLLVATLKLFFKRPREVKPILGQLFVKAVADFSVPDVHDRALFYYRLLSSDIDRCKEVVLLAAQPTGESFVEEEDGFEVDRLFEEFNSLSVIYHEGSERFIKDDFNVDEDEDGENNEEGDERYRQEAEYYRQQEHLNNPTYDEGDLSYGTPLINLMDELRPEESQPSIQLNPAYVLDPPSFERTWKSLPVQSSVKLSYLGTNDIAEIDSHFLRNGVKSVAKGAQGSTLRFFLYAQEVATQSIILTELIINTVEQNAVANFKSVQSEAITPFTTLFEGILYSIS